MSGSDRGKMRMHAAGEGNGDLGEEDVALLEVLGGPNASALVVLYIHHLHVEPLYGPLEVLI